MNILRHTPMSGVNMQNSIDAIYSSYKMNAIHNSA